MSRSSYTKPTGVTSCAARHSDVTRTVGGTNIAFGRHNTLTNIVFGRFDIVLPVLTSFLVIIGIYFGNVPSLVAVAYNYVVLTYI